jgi:hypothetical protein
MCAEKSEGAYGMQALALGGLTETGLLLAGCVEEVGG